MSEERIKVLCGGHKNNEIVVDGVGVGTHGVRRDGTPMVLFDGDDNSAVSINDLGTIHERLVMHYYGDQRDKDYVKRLG